MRGCGSSGERRRAATGQGGCALSRRGVDSPPMTQVRPALRWWILAPLCLGTGLLVGRWLPRGSQATSWPLTREAAPPAVAGVPSFAPIVDRARGAVVGVRAVVDKSAAIGERKDDDDVVDADFEEVK